MAIGARASSGFWADERINDDRLYADATTGIAYVADASGPMYGGYHAPFAIDPGLVALVGAFRATSGSTRGRIQAAVNAAQTVMVAMHDEYEARRAGRVGLEAARAAADAVTNGVWEREDALSDVFAVRSERELALIVERCAEESRDDAAAVILDVR